MTEQRERVAPELAAPVDFAMIKGDLGIRAGDHTNDAWLQRRIDAIWARFQTYTGRPLGRPAGWVDDWGELVTNGATLVEPPPIARWRSATVFLRVFPVRKITRVVMNDTEQDVGLVQFDHDDGKLLGLWGWRAADLRHYLLGSRCRIEYVAGFDPIPADLYDALLGALQPLWASRQLGPNAVGGMMATRIQAIDVGTIDLSSAANLFIDQSAKRGAPPDPLIGSYGMLLDPYVDWRSIIGGAYPTTKALEAAP